MIINSASSSEFVTVNERTNYDDIEELIERYGRPYRYKQYSYFFKDDQVIGIEFEDTLSEIKFWHINRHCFEYQ